MTCESELCACANWMNGAWPPKLHLHFCAKQPHPKSAMSTEERLCLIISCTEKDSENAFGSTYKSAINQRDNPFNLSIIAWCSASSQLKSSPCHIVKSSRSFLGDLPSSLSVLSRSGDGCKTSYVLLCSCGVVFKENCFSFLKDNIQSEYSNSDILTAHGIRIFPHEPIDNPCYQLREDTHWKLYNHTKTDRAVHVFTPEFCFLRMELLQVISSRYSNPPFSRLGHLWWSFVLGHFLHYSVWKIQMDHIVDVSHIPPPQLVTNESGNMPKLFNDFYFHIVECNWPPSITQPFHNTDKLQAVLQSNKQPHEIWQEGFGGVNMSAEPATELDFTAAAAYGIRVIRIGAVCDAKDLAFLMDPQASTVEEDRAHFLQALPRLRNAIHKAAENGLNVIITMTDLPGGRFHSHSEELCPLSFWESAYSRTRTAKFWGLVAESLADLNTSIMGYDVINEPYTPADMDVCFFDDMPWNQADKLNQFYLDVLREIRMHDSQTTVIIKSTWFSSPRTIDILRPLPDPNVAYGFHMYAPHYLTLHRRFSTHTGTYPGHIPRWPNSAYPEADAVEVTPDYLNQLLEKTVHSWQVKHRIPSNRILVAEFGICREVQGAQQYLEDLITLFQRFKWNWLLFSFRDEEWDALDYELGPSMDNMLNRSPTKLFRAVADHFH